MLRITSAQINPTVGDIDGNIALMLNAARRARLDEAQIVVFPELSLTGYYPGDMLDDEHFLQRVDAGLASLKLATRETPDLHWIVGAPMRRAGQGKRLHNALLVIRNGEVLLQYNKQLLPTYGVFDERRHFEPGADAARVLRIGTAQVGLMICEDGWNDDEGDYLANPFQRLADAAPDLIISINASPSTVGRRERRHAVFSKACARHALPLLWLGQVGGQDSLVYDGASFAVDADGEIVYEASRFASDVTTLQFDPTRREFTDLRGMDLPAVPAAGLPTMEFYRQQIVLGLRDYARRCGFTQAVIGSSGGIDSALTLALAAEAFGPANVVAITMPSKFSSIGSVTDSMVLCENLGIRLEEFAIVTVIAAFESSMLASTLAEPPSGVALENLQARVRGMLLMTYSNMHGHLLLTTGNKSELSVGYFTTYGDAAGGLGLIGDLYKTEIFELCRHINTVAGRELIPAVIIDKPPSAELAPGQMDSDSLPPYPVLDDILKIVIEGPAHLAEDERIAAQARMADLQSTPQGQVVIDRVLTMISRSEHKRRQTPPVIRLRGRAFGSGRQMPIAAKHF